MKACNSCKRAVENDRSAVAFPCPSCGKEVARCGACRKIAVRYRCNECGSEGP